MSPLRGVKVIELGGLAPSPFCGMILADFGASVTVVDRTTPVFQPDILSRGKRSIALDIKKPKGAKVFKKMCLTADVIVEPFRTGVMEKLNLGPDVLLKENPRLIYARLTGYGQSGSYALKAGHDINYLAISGMLSRLGRKTENPLPPINLLADFGGGGLVCAMGIMAALLQRANTGKGQVIDSNMVEGAAYVGSWVSKAQDTFIFGKPRGENVLDSGTHFYETYRTKDDKFMAVGSLEPQFYTGLLQGLCLTEDDLPHQGDFDKLKSKLGLIFATKTRDEWTAIFDNIDACVTPVLELDEAKVFPHSMERGAFAKSDKGELDPVPAPRLSSMPDVKSIVGRPQPHKGEHTREILAESGYTEQEIDCLLQDGVVDVGQTSKAKL